MNPGVCYVCDEDGDPKLFSIRGMDTSNPDVIYQAVLTVRPGGMVVAIAQDTRPITIPLPAPETPTDADVKAAQAERAADTEEKEREAARMEREAREAAQRERTARKAGAPS